MSIPSMEIIRREDETYVGFFRLSIFAISCSIRAALSMFRSFRLLSRLDGWSWIGDTLSSAIICIRDDVEVDVRRRCCSRSSSSRYLADAVADEMISSAALAKEDVVGMSSGGRIGGPVVCFLELPCRWPGGAYDDGGAAVVREDDAIGEVDDDIIPLFVLPRVRTMGTGLALSSSS